MITRARGRLKHAARFGLPRAPKPKGTLAAGLLDRLPEQPGPWLQRCIEQWDLVAPYDPSVTEQQWEAYFKERAALEWYTDKLLALVEGDEEEGGSRPAKRWPFDWRKPHLTVFRRESYHSDEDEAGKLDSLLGAMRDEVHDVVAGCKGLGGAASLADALSSGLFITEYWTDSDEIEWPRTLEINARLYSPCALATCWEFKYERHYRNRGYYIEHFCTSTVHQYGPGDADPAWPQASKARGGEDEEEGEEDEYEDDEEEEDYEEEEDRGTVLFSMWEEHSGYQDRRMVGEQALRSLAAHLFGRRGRISARKTFALAAAACGVTAMEGADENWVWRENRRRRELEEDEESEGLGGDEDSDNEALEFEQPQYPDPFGFFGYGSDSDEYDEEEDEDESDEEEA